MLINRIHALFAPEQYHGWGKTKRYFEGWYYKVINAAEDQAFAFIPGIAMDETGKQQAFIQVLDGKKHTAAYHRFEAQDFIPTPKTFAVQIGENHFSKTNIQLQLPNIKGQLQFQNQVPWPTAWYSPGIMGPFSFVPFMECYHGILSMNHTIEGSLDINDKTIDFSGGRGYMEKDWGRSFPEGYIWMQSNHFSQPDISLKASIAKIPWLGSHFIGFIAGLWLQNRLIQFTTYNFTRLRKCVIDTQNVEIVLENPKYHLQIQAKREAATILAAPILGFMDGRIEESMTSQLAIQLTDKKTKQILLDDTGHNAGLEVAGKVELLRK